MKPSVIIFGAPNLYNEMLSYVLQRELQDDVVIAENLALYQDELSGHTESRQLILVDYHTANLDRLLQASAFWTTGGEDGRIVALFNLEHKAGIEQKAIKRGVKGFFYEGDTLYLVMKGIGKLLDGEIWVPREMLYALAQNGGGAETNESGGDEPSLTNREMQVLAHVCMGLSNDEIAETLNLSPHTIKTHLYRIFKKIGVENRFQASLWASKHL